MMRRPGFHWSGLAVWSALLAAAMPAAETNLPPSPPGPRYQNVTADVQWRHLSPVEYFRGLLGMSPGERERALARKSPADRTVLLAKLREYEALPRGIREARLCQTELHWELSGLMKLAPRDRTNRLAEVSPLYLPMIEELLRQWDKVPAGLQKALLEKQSFISVYLRMQGARPRPGRRFLTSFRRRAARIGRRKWTAGRPCRKNSGRNYAHNFSAFAP